MRHRLMLRSRRVRHAWFSAISWRRRLAFWGGALVVGFVSVGFALAADHVQDFAEQVFTRYPLAPFVVSPALFALSAWLAVRFFPGSQGSGIPHSIAGRRVRNAGGSGQDLLAARLAVGKILLTLLGLLAGASIGREGPTVQVGASIMMLAAGLAGLTRERGFILAGAAAGIAAAFNTPLAGLVFAIEEMARAYEHRTSGLVLLAVILAGIVSVATVGYYEYFGHTAVTVGLLNGWQPVLVLGLSGGLLGGLFARIVLTAAKRLRRWFGKGVLHRPATFAAACGLVVATAGYLTAGGSFGTGYHAARGAIEGTTLLDWSFVAAKLVSTTASTVSGIPGGLLAPSLSVGAGLGSAFSPLFTDVPPGAAAMLGMVAYFVGVTQAPMTGFVLVMEMTGNHSMLVPLMSSTMLALGVSRMICPVPLYHGLAMQILRTRGAPKHALAAKQPDEPPVVDSPSAAPDTPPDAPDASSEQPRDSR